MGRKSEKESVYVYFQVIQCMDWHWQCVNWLCGSQQTGKFLKRWEYQTTLPASWETYIQVKKQQSVQFSSVAQSCPTLSNPMNRSMPGLPVHHQLPELTQTDVHRVSDAIQPSHPLSSPSPSAPNPSQHQSLFQWVSSSHEVAKVPNMEQWTDSKLGKEYIQAVCCHLVYLTYMQSTCAMLGWKHHQLESRLPGEISTTSDMQMIPL